MQALLSIGISNALIASVLAAVVWFATRGLRHPTVAHALWLLVLVKLITPPLVHVTVPQMAQLIRESSEAAWEVAASDGESSPGLAAMRGAAGKDVPPALEGSPQVQYDRQAHMPAHKVDAAYAAESTATPLSQPRSTESDIDWIRLLAGMWIAGSGAVLILAFCRIVRFHRLLQTTFAAPGEVSQLAESLRKHFKIRSCVQVRLIDAQAPPLVWPIGRRKVVLLPSPLVERLSPRELETVLAHELAHLKRGDHLVRWVELAATILYWWLPTTWWARRQLRQAEEAACDAWVLSVLPHRAREYANALVQAALMHSCSVPPLPLVASGLSDGRRLVRRISGLSHVRGPRLGRRHAVWIVMAAILVLPASLTMVDSAAQGRQDASREANTNNRDATDEAPQDRGAEGDASDSQDAPRREAIERGVAFLKARQQDAGNWEDLNLFRGGMTALCTLALLEAGVPLTDQAVSKALAWLRENDHPEKTYVVSLVTRAYARAGLPEDRGRIKRNADWLGSSMVAEGEYQGAWGYQDGAQDADNSNTSYAILGLEAAEAAGVEVPEGVWRAALDYWLRSQNRDGSWGYKPRVGGIGSMTSSGIASLAVISSQLGDLAPEDARAASRALDRANDWLTVNYSVAGNPYPNARGAVSRWHYYYLAALTGAMRRTQQAKLGDHDWWSDATNVLLKEQQADGSWFGEELESDSALATALALLVLGHGRDARAQGAGLDNGDEALRIGSIIELPSTAPLTTKYQFSVDGPKGTRFQLWLRIRQPKGTGGHTFVLEKEKDGPTDVVLTYELRQQVKGNGSPNVLLSAADEVQARAEAEDCYPSGVTTIVGVPLHHLPLSEKKIELLAPDDPRSRIANGRRLLVILPEDKKPQNSEEVEQIEPRGELLVLHVPTPQPEPPPSQNERVLAAWNRLSTGIGTTHIVFTRLSGGELKPVAPAELQLQMIVADLENRPENILDIVPHLVEDNKRRERLERDWGRDVFRSVGLVSYHTHHEAGELLDARWCDGELDIHYDPRNGQCDVYRFGDSRLSRMHLGDFALVATLEILKRSRFTAEKQLVKILSRKDEELAVVDRDTGLIRWFTTNVPNGSEVFQFAPQTTSTGITFPTLRINADYRGHKLDSLEVILVKELHINEGFDDNDLKLPLPAGTKLFDYREDTLRGEYHEVKEDVSDAAVFVRGGMK